MVENTIELLQTSYDVAILGSNLESAILAGSCARSKKSVIHIYDPQLLDTESTLTPSQICSSKDKEDLMTSMVVMNEIPATDDKYYQFDLFPRLFYGGGPLVDSLIKSGCARYLNARTIFGTYYRENEQWIKVPSSRSDIFTSACLNLEEKRLLMKFILSCENISSENEPLLNILKNCGWSDRLITFLSYGLLLHEIRELSSLSVKDATLIVKYHLKSLDKYARNTVFLYPAYGVNDTVQAFLRYSAVAGAIQLADYCETENITQMPNNNKWIVRGSNGLNIVASHLVVAPAKYKSQLKDVFFQPLETATFSRVIVCSTEAILSGERQNDSCLFVIPPNTQSFFCNPNPVFVLQLDSDAQVCPPGKYVIYIWTRKDTNTTRKYCACHDSFDFSKAVKHFFATQIEKCIFVSFFEQNVHSYDQKVFEDRKVYPLTNPILTWDMEATFTKSRNLYEHIVDDQSIPFLSPFEEIHNEDAVETEADEF